MIEDVFTELTVGAVDRLLSPEAPRDDADVGLARLNARLTPRSDGEDRERRQVPTDEFQSALEPRLFVEYLRLGTDDVVEISPRVHDWVLERLSNSDADVDDDAIAEALRNRYFLFPESTVRHSVIGLLLQADVRGERSRRPRVAVIVDAIDRDEGLSLEEREEALQLLGELLVDFIDVFPTATLRALAVVIANHREGRLTRQFIEWSRQIGGVLGERMRRVIETGRDSTDQ